MNRKLINLTKHSIMFAFIITAYQNCGSPDSASQAVSFSSTNTSANNGDIVAIPNTKTTSIVRASRTLDTLVSCLGTQKPSDDSKRALTANAGTISEEGLANSVTQPMLKSVITIAAEVCNDLYDLEVNQTDQERKIFIGVDFTQGGFEGGALLNSAKRLSRSCWGRNITEDELSTLNSDVARNLSDGEDNRAKTKQKIIYLCTAMASSFATVEM